MTVTVPGSLVEAARIQLAAAINAHPTITAAPTPGISPVLVEIDEPALEHYRPEDIIWIGGVDITYPPGALVGTGGAGARQEHFTVEVNVSVYRGGDNAALAFTRARQLVDAVNAAVRTDPTLGLGQGSANVPAGAGYVWQAWPTRAKYDPHWEQEHKGREVDVTLEIEVDAWL